MEPLTIIPCSKTKAETDRPIQARRLYSPSQLFSLNYRFAQAMKSRPIILSARYGFIQPSDVIESYEETFSRPTENTVSEMTLETQAVQMRFYRHPVVYLLGGIEYRGRARRALVRAGVKAGLIVEPFAGMPIGKMKQALAAQIKLLEAHR